jgi:hypothetical protein
VGFTSASFALPFISVSLLREQILGIDPPPTFISVLPLVPLPRFLSYTHIRTYFIDSRPTLITLFVLLHLRLRLPILLCCTRTPATFLRECATLPVFPFS